MVSLKKYTYMKWLVVTIISLTLMTGYSGYASQTNKTTENSYEKQEDATKKFLLSLVQLAREGKVLDCKFPAKTTVIDEVVEKWGEPEKTEWISEYKGIYAEYPKYNVIFGFNKGSQIFEVISFHDEVKKISLSEIKKVLGKPKYDVRVNGKEIIGYIANSDFKLLFIFPGSTTESPNPLVDHYSVLYPRGTINLMSEDPGREW